MLVYEIDRKTLREYHGDVNKIIEAGEYVPRDDEFIRRAFNNGHGTERDFARYREDNKIFCKWYDTTTRAFI